MHNTIPVVSRFYRFPSSRFPRRIYRVDSIDSAGVHMTVVRMDPIEIIQDVEIVPTRFEFGAIEVIL